MQCPQPAFYLFTRSHSLILFRSVVYPIEHVFQQLSLAAHTQEKEEEEENCLGNYQSYCCQVISPTLNKIALRMLRYLRTLQLRDHPCIGRLLGRRYICSLKEVSKIVPRAQLLLIAPDIRASSRAQIDPLALLHKVMATATLAGVPYVFCLSRRDIGRVFGRTKSMSIVAVMHIHGIENEFVTLLEEALRESSDF